MSYILKPNNHIYRETVPSTLRGDLLIVSLIHQGRDMLDYMIQNVDKFVDGSKLFIVHLNINEQVNENELPDWVWIARNTVNTDRYNRSILNAVNECLLFAFEHFTFKNMLSFSSGSVFIRTFTVPIHEVVHVMNTEYLINPETKSLHNEPIHISKKGEVAAFLKRHGHFPWQYEGCDKDTKWHTLIENRGFQFFKGCSWSGQLIPYNACKMMSDDLITLRNEPEYDYCCEEIFISTYGFNYALQNNIQPQKSILLTNWDHYYNIEHIEYVNAILNSHLNNIVMICKVPDNINHPVRTIINTVL
jgi:hypothetical protein